MQSIFEDLGSLFGTIGTMAYLLLEILAPIFITAIVLFYFASKSPEGAIKHATEKAIITYLASFFVFYWLGAKFLNLENFLIVLLNLLGVTIFYAISGFKKGGKRAVLSLGKVGSISSVREDDLKYLQFMSVAKGAPWTLIYANASDNKGSYTFKNSRGVFVTVKTDNEGGFVTAHCYLYLKPSALRNYQSLSQLIKQIRSAFGKVGINIIHYDGTYFVTDFDHLIRSLITEEENIKKRIKELEVEKEKIGEGKEVAERRATILEEMQRLKDMQEAIEATIKSYYNLRDTIGTASVIVGVLPCSTKPITFEDKESFLNAVNASLEVLRLQVESIIQYAGTCGFPITQAITDPAVTLSGNLAIGLDASDVDFFLKEFALLEKEEDLSPFYKALEKLIVEGVLSQPVTKTEAVELIPSKELPRPKTPEEAIHKYMLLGQVIDPVGRGRWLGPERNVWLPYGDNSEARHIIVIGKTGAGKTVILKNIAESCALSGIPVIILDFGNIYSSLLKPNEKPFTDWSTFGFSGNVSRGFQAKIYTVLDEELGIPFYYNLLQRPVYAKTDEQLAAEAKERVEIISRLTEMGKTTETKNLLMDAIIRAWKLNYPLYYDSLILLLQEFAKNPPRGKEDYVKKYEKLAETLKTALLPYKSLLSPFSLRIENLLESGVISIISFYSVKNEEVMREMSRLIIRELTKYLESLGETKGARVYLIIDEVKRLVEKKQRVYELEQVFERWRKYGGRIVAASQRYYVHFSPDARKNVGAIIWGQTDDDSELKKIREVVGKEAAEILASDTPPHVFIMDSGMFPKSVFWARPPFSSETPLSLDEIRNTMKTFRMRMVSRKKVVEDELSKIVVQLLPHVTRDIDLLKEETVKIQCPHCGRTIVGEYEECPYCGGKIDKSEYLRQKVSNLLLRRLQKFVKKEEEGEEFNEMELAFFVKVAQEGIEISKAVEKFKQMFQKEITYATLEKMRNMAIKHLIAECEPFNIVFNQLTNEGKNLKRWVKEKRSPCLNCASSDREKCTSLIVEKMIEELRKGM